MTPKDLTDSELRHMVAEALGWKELHEVKCRQPFLVGCDPKIGLKDSPPDYPNDLNACHKMENSLPPTSHKGDEYRDILKDVVEKQWLLDKTSPPFAIFATARQRCIAFLRTVGRIL